MRAPASYFSHCKSYAIVFPSTREDLQEFRSRAAASGSSRIPPTSQIAFKEKEDSLFVPGASKQMNILSRLGIKVSRPRLATVLVLPAHASPSKRKSPHSADKAAAPAPTKASAPPAAPAPTKASAQADSSGNADSLGSSSAHVNVPGASTKAVVAAAAPDSGLSALLDYDDSDD